MIEKRSKNGGMIFALKGLLLTRRVASPFFPPFSSKVKAIDWEFEKPKVFLHLILDTTTPPPAA